jgi:3-hydroxyisobutyrate dehydrogenase-like beta-hydroxyacid dehydrogenase
MTDRITELLQEGIRETIENRDETAFERAAKEAYTVRTAGRALSDDDAIINHVFPSDVRQTVALGIHLVDSDKEKASVVLKGALEAVLQRLSAVPPGQWQAPEHEKRRGKGWWPFGKR